MASSVWTQRPSVLFCGPVAGVCAILTFIVLYLFFKGYFTRRRERDTVCILVLGDFGRSPRMQYHTESLLYHANKNVDVVAFGGSQPIDAICCKLKDDRNQTSVKIHNLRSFPRLNSQYPRIFFLLYAPVKVFVQIMQLLWVLLIRVRGGLSHVIVQNPPSIPSLAVAWLVCRFRRASFVIDWHNYGHTILALSLNEKHWLVSIAKTIERFFGRLGDAHLCVTDAMRNDLIKKWGIDDDLIATFHDRPPAMFHPSSEKDRDELFARLSALQNHTGDAFRRAFEMAASNGQTRPAVLVSSTSWTPDEDFSILLRALEAYDSAPAKLPTLLCVITGKGPQRAYYERLMRSRPMRRVVVATAWLSFTDYPLLLGAADVGVSLHYSSSGLDLPMKVVDMFGAGLPVCAIDFDCLSELVQHEKNSLVFSDHTELSAQLQRLLGANGGRELGAYRKQLEGFRKDGWTNRWNRIVRNLLFTRRGGLDKKEKSF